jgi:hypothetical protein
LRFAVVKDGHADVVQRALVIVEARRSEPTIVPGLFLCQRKPATTQSAARMLDLDHRARAATYGESRRFAIRRRAPRLRSV